MCLNAFIGLSAACKAVSAASSCHFSRRLHCVPTTSWYISEADESSRYVATVIIGLTSVMCVTMPCVAVAGEHPQRAGADGMHCNSGLSCCLVYLKAGFMQQLVWKAAPKTSRQSNRLLYDV